ncbi:Cell cycle serine/threonine-protein kinase cdc5/MSD2 [Mortierella alpina]|nr:Cell cycle serine/threonine-protein kinase cdc5/MSD2 [Mortierella alpina]
MASYTTPLSAPRRQQPMTTPSAAERALNAPSAHSHSPQHPAATRASQNLQQRNAFSPASSMSSSSSRSHTNSHTPAGQQPQQQQQQLPQQQQSGIPRSRIGSVSSIPTAAGTTGSATTAPGRRLQYQLPVSSRLDGHHFMPSPSQPQQQQQPPVPGSGNIRSSHYSQGGQGGQSGQGGTPSSLPVMGTASTAGLSHQQPKQRQRPVHTGYGHSFARHASAGVMATGAGSSLRGQHANTNPNTNTMGAGGMMTTSVINTHTHTQMGTTTNVNMNTQTQTGTTNIDKPKTRKKDKPPKVPPPETIRDNTGQMSYNRGPNLGEGGFASCYMISDQKNDRYAAKVIQKSELLTHKTKQKASGCNPIARKPQIKVHQSMVHENIVKYYHCFEDDDFVYLVLELCESKTLMELIKRRKRLTEPEVRFYMKEIVAGCAYMHHHKVIHRDLKLGNVFLTRELHCRIGDFGLAAVILNDERKKTICGTPNYIAPEILFDTENGHSYQADIWSVGVIMYTLLIGKPPFQTPEVKGIYKKIRDCNYVFPEDIPVSEEARNLVAALLNPRPESRPSMADVLDDDFFTCGYCPERLDRKTLYSAPNFVQEEIQWRQQFQSPETRDGSEPPEADDDVLKEEEECEPNPPMAARSGPARQQQLHCDQTSFEEPSTGQQPPQGRRSSSLDPGPMTDVKVKEPSSPTPQPRSTPGVPTRTIPSSNRQQQQQLKGSPGSENAPRFHYGEQVRMEMLDGDRVTTEIRTINVPRAAAGPMGGRLAPNFQQYSQAHARLHKEEHNRQQPHATSLTGNDTSNSVSASVSTLHQPQLRGSSAATASRNATVNLPSQAGQMSVSRSGIMASGAQSFTGGRHESGLGMSASVPTLPTPGSLPLSSRLPVPKTRQSSTLALNPASLYQQPGVDHQPQTMSTPTRSGFGFAPSPTLTKGASSSPRPANSMTMGGSTPNLAAISRQAPSMQGDFHQQPHSPSPISRRRSSDMASIQGGSTFGKTVYSRRQDPIGRQQQRSREQWTPPRAQERNSTGARYEDFMATDVDTDMEMEHQRDHDMPQHLDLLVDKMSDMPPSPFVRRGNSQPPQGQLRDLNGRAGGLGLTTTSTTLIQTVHGVERPASAMQRTFSQELEFSETNRGLESPRKVSRTLHSQSHSHSLSQSQAQSQGYPRSQPQQQHSFLVQSSQQGSLSSPNTPNTLKHHSSQPLPSPSTSHFHQRHNHRASREWPADMMGLGLGLTEQEQHYGDVAGQSTSPTQSQLPRLGRSSLSAQPSQSSPHMRQSSGNYELESNEMEVVGQVGGMVTSTETRENMHLDDDDQYQSASLHQQQQQQQLHSQKQLIQRSPSQSQDPYRYQFTSPLQRRNQEAKQQQQQMQQQLQQRSLQHSQSSPRAAEPGSPIARSTSSSGYAVRVDPASNSVSLSMSVSHSRALSQTREEFNSHPSLPESRSSSWSRSQPAQHPPHSQQQQQQQEEDGKRLSISVATPPRQSHPSDSLGGDEGDTSRSLQEPLEESSVDQSSIRDEYDGQGTRQLARSNSLRQQSQSQLHSQTRVQQDQKLLDSPQENADTANNGHNNNNNATKQSNETTMAGMSSGGHSDEQDHVEVPSTSCVTTTSLSLISMHPPQPSEPRKQAQSSSLPPNPLDLGMSAQTEPGCREEVERYLRTMIKARQEGMLGLPELGRRASVPEAPTVFLTRWIKYERYGIGWHLANGVIGVRCNDIITLVLSPNGDDIEIIQMPTKRKSASGHNSLETAAPSSAEAIEAVTETVDGWVARDFYEGWDHDDFLAQLEHTYCRMNRYPPRFDKKIRILTSFRNYMIQMLTGLPPWAYEDVHLTRDLPFLTDFFQAPHVVARLSNGVVQVNFVDHTKVILSDRGRVLTFIDGEEKPRRLTMTVHQAFTPEYFYDPKDEADQHLLIQTELDQIAVYQEHRQQQRDLRMTSMTDEDMTTMSSRDESVDYEDSEESGHKRKLGMMSIDSAPSGLDRLGYRETRPVFNPETDHDLVLFPRPKLVAKNRRRKSRYQPQDRNQQQQQDQRQSSKNLLELDASQQELVDITTEDETAVISQLTFKQLHEQIVRRLRLTQRLLQNRRIELAEEQRRDRLGREQALREGGEDNKARRERRERERAKEKGKKQPSSQEKEHKEKKERSKDKKSENQQQQDQRGSSSNSLSPGGLVGQGRESKSPPSESGARVPSSPALGCLDNKEKLSALRSKESDDHLFKVPQPPLVRHASEGGHALGGKTKKAYDLSLKSVQQHLARLQQQEQPQSPTHGGSSGGSRQHGRRTRSRTDHIKFDSKYSPPRDTPSLMRHYGGGHTYGNGHGNGNGNGNGNGHHNPNYGSSSFSSSDSSSFVSSGFGVPNERSLSLSSSQFRVQDSGQAQAPQLQAPGQGILEESEPGSGMGMGMGLGRGRGRGRDASGEQDGHRGRKRLSQPASLQHLGPNSPIPSSTPQFDDDVLAVGPRLSLSPTL